MTSQAAPSEPNQKYLIYFDGITQIQKRDDRAGLIITMSTPEKVRDMMHRCQFTESNPDPVYCKYGFATRGNEYEAILWGPSDATNKDILNVFQRVSQALNGHDSRVKPFEFVDRV